MTQQVSFRLLRLAGKIHTDDTAPDMISSLATFAELPNINLRSIIDGLAHSCYADQALLADEFIDQFCALQGPRLLVERFINKLEPPKHAHTDEESTASARKDLHAFICRYSESSITLHTWISQQQLAYPDVDFRNMFDEEMQSLMAQEIEKTAKIIAENKYHGIFQKNPELFILDFITNRILHIKRDPKTGKTDFKIETRALNSLLEFINKEGYPLEKLYMLLYQEIMTMRGMKANPESIKASTRMALSAVETLDGNPLFDDDFDFDVMFKGQFVPAILSARYADLCEKKYLRLVDITDLSPEGLSKVLIPRDAMAPVLEKLKAVRTEEDYIRVLRENFNYQKSEEKEGDKIAALSDKELITTLTAQLDEVREIIGNILEKGLERRPKNDGIEKACRFIPEIFKSKSVRDLFRWMAAPEDFMEEYPQYQRKYNYKIVRFQCRRMLEMLLLYRRYAFREDVKKAEENRRILKEQMVDDLQIKNAQEHIETYRVRVKVDSATLQPGENPQYEVVRDDSALSVNPNSEYTDYEPGPEGEGASDGSWYRYYPVENKVFQEADVSIPTGDGGRKEGKVYIYSGDGKTIHSKGLSSYVSSILRGKKPTDLLRWMIVTDDKEMSDALRNHLYENYSTGNYVVIKDNAEGRKMTRKKDPGTTGNSEKFRQSRLYSASLYATVPLKNGPEGHEHSHIGFEIQIQELEKMLIANSHHTIQSHDRVYTPEREFGNIFQYLFPPALYGQRYADYWLQGFDGKQAL
ncbi:MAG: hypothetical protein R3B71_00580 [Candidatus Gracilibacteria bacterium]